MDWRILLAKIGIRYFLQTQTADKLLKGMMSTVGKLDNMSATLVDETFNLDKQIADLVAKQNKVSMEAQRSKNIAENFKKLMEVN